MIHRKHTDGGDVYYVGTVRVDDVILHFRFFTNEPNGTPRIEIDGREAAGDSTRNLMITPTKRITRAGRSEQLREALEQVDKTYKR